MLSGDSQAAVEHMMADLPPSQTHGGLLPVDKVTAIKTAQARGEKVMFVGDGINDGLHWRKQMSGWPWAQGWMWPLILLMSF